MKDEPIFTKGQKVIGTYHSTWNTRGKIKAVVLGKAFKKYHLFSHYNNPNGVCQWYWIRKVGNIFPSLYPSTCLQDEQEFKKQELAFLEYGMQHLGKPGYSIGTYNKLKSFVDSI